MKETFLFSSTFIKSTANLPKHTKAKLFKTFNQLLRDFNHPSLQVKKFKSNKSVTECRVDKSYRLIFDTADDFIRCLFVGNHDEALRFAANFSQSPKPFFSDDIVSISNSPDIAIGVPVEEDFFELSLTELADKIDFSLK